MKHRQARAGLNNIKQIIIVQTFWVPPIHRTNIFFFQTYVRLPYASNKLLLATNENPPNGSSPTPSPLSVLIVTPAPVLIPTKPVPTGGLKLNAVKSTEKFSASAGSVTSGTIGGITSLRSSAAQSIFLKKRCAFMVARSRGMWYPSRLVGSLRRRRVMRSLASALR